ncbi:MAG: biotin--[Clostridia bacterium]|nr:biotin--[acetyl-CoA-carboxylase] ligase [Clostridia bacterium]
MTIKEAFLEQLELHRGKYISGQKFAEEHHITRAAVWKIVRELEADGYSIKAQRNAGYCIDDDCEILSASGIVKYLSDPTIEVYFRECSESTNLLARQSAVAGVGDRIYVSAQQTAGRGRLGRSFYSPAGCGIYMSLLLHPNMLAVDAQRITTAAAVAVCRAVDSLLHEVGRSERCQIKWVNDIYLNGKKICGILTEAELHMETGKMNYAVLGIGINVRRPKNGFPAEIADRAGAIFDADSDTVDVFNRLAGSIVNEFFRIYRKDAPQVLNPVYFLREYKDRSLVIGREVEVIQNDETRPARAIAIDDDCRLVVRYNDGVCAALSSGEVSIKV